MTTKSDQAAGVGFDVGAFTRTAHGSLSERFDLRAIPVSADTASLLRSVSVLEGATMAHLRNVLVTATHKDARVTAFLVTWAFEKYWIADALATLARDPGARGGEGPASTRAAARGLPGGPVRRSVGGFLAGTSIVGVHTVAGLVDDLVLDAAYDAVQTDASPQLRALVADIRDIKSRHTAFFGEESRARLAGDRRAQRLAARSIRRGPWPIGAPLLDAADHAAFASAVFGASEGAGREAAVARLVGELPGIRPSDAAAVQAALEPAGGITTPKGA